MATISALILTYNEESNIGACIGSCRNVVDKIIVMDNNSNDRTKEIAESLGALVDQSDLTYKKRFAKGISHPYVDTDWIIYMDADERLTPESSKELKKMCDRYLDSDITGIVCRYVNCFLGKEIRHGDSVGRKLRVFKKGCAAFETKELDEHVILLRGREAYMKTDILHLDFRGLEHWINKHNGYAKRTAKEHLDGLEKELPMDGLAKVSRIRRNIKNKIYYKLPMGMRAHLLYIYRYYFRLGFLDGNEGKILIFLHAYWYRFLVDSYICEYQKEAQAKDKKNNGETG